MRFSEKKIATILRQHGYKFTPQRWAVIQAIASSQDHLTPADIYNKVHQEHPKIGLVTVYRTLGLLDNLGLLCKLHTGGDCHALTIGTPECHHHLICSGCGKVIDFSCRRMAELEGNLAEETGFTIKDHLLEFTGYCQNCRKDLM